MASDDITTTTLIGFRDGKPFQLNGLIVECGHYLEAACAIQAKEAIRAGRDDGLTISIDSAFRSMAQQTELYEAHQRDPEHANPADPPGFSKHQEGVAIDLGFGKDMAAHEEERTRFAALAIAHGFTRPVEHEPWHFVITLQLKEHS